jgi:Protein of unknown function (DUF3602)
VSIGRGGAGNIRSRSRSQARSGVESHPQASNHIVVSTGRGGVGNIRDRSKSKARADAPHDLRDVDERGTDHHVCVFYSYLQHLFFLSLMHFLII